MKTILALLLLCVSASAQLVINNQAAAAASISVQPVSVTCVTNTTTNFTVTAAGTAPLAYQWQTNSVNLSDVAGYSGATTATLWVSNVVIVQSNWSFRCIVTNAYGSITSSVATLTVTNGGCTAPTISAQPASVTCITNTTTNFTLTAAGTEPFSYQWQTNSVNVTDVAGYSGSTTATLWVSNAVIGQSNWAFQCIVTNACGSITSSVATLTVTNGTGGGGGGWTPTNMDNLIGWWAGDGTNASQNDTVTTLPDWSTNGKTMAGNSSSLYCTRLYTNLLNGHNVIAASNTVSICSGLNSTTFMCTQYMEFFVVAKFLSPGTDRKMFIKSYNSGNDRMDVHTTGVVEMYVTGVGNVADSTVITNKWYVFDFVWDPAHGAIFTNGVATSVSDQATSSATAIMNGLQVGACPDAGTYYLWAEVLAFNTNFGVSASNVNRSNVVNYLLNKYAITP